MSWFSRWLPPRAAHQAVDESRWVVLDVESSGLDPRKDRLLAIAALAVQIDKRRATIALADSFELVLQQVPDARPPDRPNILLHGIGLGAQRQGVAPRLALERFAAFAKTSPLIAFHAAFDRRMIDRACRAQGLLPPANPWLDLEPLAAVLMPQVKARSLDEWMAALGIRCAVRHQAAADTLATAEMLLKLWPALYAELPQPSFKAAAQLADQRRWIPG